MYKLYLTLSKILPVKCYKLSFLLQTLALIYFAFFVYKLSKTLFESLTELHDHQQINSRRPYQNKLKE